MVINDSIKAYPRLPAPLSPLARPRSTAARSEKKLIIFGRRRIGMPLAIQRSRFLTVSPPRVVRKRQHF